MQQCKNHWAKHAKDYDVPIAHLMGADATELLRIYAGFEKGILDGNGNPREGSPQQHHNVVTTAIARGMYLVTCIIYVVFRYRISLLDRRP